MLVSLTFAAAPQNWVGHRNHARQYNIANSYVYTCLGTGFKVHHWLSYKQAAWMMNSLPAVIVQLTDITPYKQALADLMYDIVFFC